METSNARLDHLDAKAAPLERVEALEARLGTLETQFAQLTFQLRWEAHLRENDERLLAAAINRLVLTRPMPTQRRSPQRGRLRKRK